MKLNVFCPYGNMYPEHSLWSVSLTIISSFAILVLALLILEVLYGNHNLSKKKKIFMFILGVFTVVTFVLNILMSQW